MNRKEIALMRLREMMDELGEKRYLLFKERRAIY